jgi:thiol-disulfide isomerase/thioredoxin
MTLATLLVPLLLAYPGRSNVEEPFRDLSFDAALAEAGKSGRIVLIDFCTTWCAPCKKLDQTTWKDEKVRAWLAEKTVALKLDAEKEVALAKRYSVQGYPTILFLKSDATPIDRIVGYRSPEAFLSEASDALAGKTAIARAKEAFAGHENDPMARGEYADALAEAGFNAEALDHYLWCFDHGLEHSPSYVGVRLSFLLSDITDLGKNYPPALQALAERRDAAEKKLLDASPATTDFERVSCAQDVSALNGALEQDERTLALYDRLASMGESFAKTRGYLAMGNSVDTLLIERRRYGDFLALWHDSPAKLTRRIASFERKSKGRASAGAIEKKEDGDDAPRPDEIDIVETMLEHERGEILRLGSMTYEALLGTDQLEAALALETKLTAFDPSGATCAELIDHALRVPAPEAARALAKRALERLHGTESDKVRRAADRIPAKKD